VQASTPLSLPYTPQQEIMTEIEGKSQHLYKVLVIGDYAVGKTSIIKRYCEGYFTPNYKLTIGVDFAVKVVEWDEKTTVSLQVCFLLINLLFFIYFLFYRTIL
jgi:GTPase SAR1 family protein